MASSELLPGRTLRRYDEVTVLFADLAGFTPMSATMTPEEVVSMLNEVFVRFDAAAERLGLEKIKTIGDAYMVAGGVAGRSSDDHVEKVAEMALAMLRESEGMRAPNGQPVRLRVGIHTGSVVAGVIGSKKFAYDLWGDTVNVASRMESHGVPGRIQVTEQVYAKLCGSFELEEREPIEVRGKGTMKTYFLVGHRVAPSSTPDARARA